MKQSLRRVQLYSENRPTQNAALPEPTFSDHTSLQILEQKLDRVLALVEQMAQQMEAQPSLTVSEFASKAGISRTTVHRMLTKGELLKQNGRIPFKYLKGFLS